MLVIIICEYTHLLIYCYGLHDAWVAMVRVYMGDFQLLLFSFISE